MHESEGHLEKEAGRGLQEDVDKAQELLCKRAFELAVAAAQVTGTGAAITAMRRQPT
jgi:hypothetical protein